MFKDKETGFTSEHWIAHGFVNANTKPCRKCGSYDFATKWQSGTKENPHYIGYVPLDPEDPKYIKSREWEKAHNSPEQKKARERLSMTCENCGYFWDEAPLDQASNQNIAIGSIAENTSTVTPTGVGDDD